MAILFFIVRFVWLPNASESSNYINYSNFRAIVVDAELKMSNFGESKITEILIVELLFPMNDDDQTMVLGWKIAS